MKKFFMYSLRWQMSTPILAACIYYLPFDDFNKTMIANFIGACIFYHVDKLIFRKKKG